MSKTSETRTTKDLRDKIWDTLEAMLEGRHTHQQAREVNRGAGKIIAAKRLDLEYYRYMPDHGDGPVDL